MSIVWQDPPIQATGNAGAPRRWMAEAVELRAHPKRWALLQTAPGDATARSFASQARKGHKSAFRPVGHWEFRTHHAEVYARYVGEHEESP